MKKFLFVLALTANVAFAQNNIRKLYSAMGKITHCEFSPDGTKAVACSELVEAYGQRIASVTLYDVAKEEMTLELPIYAMFATFSPDNSKLVYWDFGAGLVLRNLSTKDDTKVLLENKMENAVFKGKFSRDGKLLALGGFDGSIKIMDVATGKVLHTLWSNEAKKLTLKLDFMKDGRLVSVGDGITKTWDVTAGKEISTLKMRNERANMVAAFATEANKVLSCFKDSTFVVDAATGKVTASNDFANFYNGAFSPKGSMYLLCDNEGVYAFNGDGTFGGKNGIGVPATQWMDIDINESKIIIGSEVNVLISDFAFFKEVANRK